jgi:hypothetical protein
MNDNSKILKEHVAGLFNRVAATYDHIGPRYFSHFGKRLVVQQHELAG